MAKVVLSDLINIPAFEQVADLFHRTTRMTISFADRDGNVVFYPYEGRCRFCHLIQATPKGLERCKESDRRAARTALSEKRPMSYTCHAGLIDVVVPVIVGDERIGCFYSGQCLLSPPTSIGFSDVASRVADLEVDIDALSSAYHEVMQVDSYKLEVAMELLAIISSYLVRGEMEVRTQQELARAAEKRARLEKNLREMELRLSQAQLNPHFLFNSLNLLLGEALNENATRTAKLIEELSVLLSNAVTNVGRMVDLESEIASTRAYVEMYRSRFGKNIRFSADLPRNLSHVKVPALILQPLVENALTHGFPNPSGSLSVQVSARANGSLVEVSVRDDGRGVPAHKLEDIQRSLCSRRHKSKLTGLVGLSQRLHYYYPKLPPLRLQHTDNGFAVTLSVPLGSSSERC